MAGLTVAGLVGATVELMAGRSLSFVEPFVSRGHVLRSLLVAAAVGPFMLCNDAVAASRAGQISNAVFATCIAIALAWVMAAGVAVVGLAVQVAALLS
jgi:hypothetical protein